MKPYLVFFDDDPTELKDLGTIISEEFKYMPVKWPAQEPIRVARMPDLIVLDLYFPSIGAPAAIPTELLGQQKARASKIAADFSKLYDEPVDGTSLLRKTFACIQEGYDLLWSQCEALGQSADNGRCLLARIRSNPACAEIPVVFYSRKATVEEAVRALQAGAFAVIPKVSSPPSRHEREAVLSHLKLAMESFRNIREQTKKSRRFKFPININVTLLKQEVVLQKLEFTVAKFG
jgi:CheY-like chemotaxis protein